MICPISPDRQDGAYAPQVTCRAADRWRNIMRQIKLAIIAAGLLASVPVLAQTAGGTQNTGPQGTGNFVAGKPEGTGNPVAGQTGRSGTPVAGKPEGSGNPVAGQPVEKMEKK
jgi:hypothetical protein